ncbi:hypothetical protein [Streptomyces sp. NPDC001851]|uniref:hypothetical protein n=1 Tax=Streptomyces sp. NPDC001851 TaxID=3154529 RepID=UPI003330083C
MSDTGSIPEPVPARPWRRDTDGPEPKVTTYLPGGAPALEVLSQRAWRRATVVSRQAWAAGRVLHQVRVRPSDTAPETFCLFQWPQDGLRVAALPTNHTTRDTMPRPPQNRTRSR